MSTYYRGKDKVSLNEKRDDILNNFTPILIKNVNIYAEQGIIANGSILIEEGKIKEIYKNGVLSSVSASTHVIEGGNLNLIPGFIDNHIHGAYGADVMDSTEEALDVIAAHLPKEGTTSFLATTITGASEKMERALVNAAHYKNKQGQAEMLGIHLEGPFINKQRAGAQPVHYILEPDLERFIKWQTLSNGSIKIITLAPEHDQDGSFIGFLVGSGVVVSAGHTDTDYAGMKKAVSYGVSGLTHLCNAMSGIHHRDIGVVGAAFQMEKLRAELIVDGVHVDQEMVKLIYKNMGSERLILITDSMRAKGLPPGEYELGGQPVFVSKEKAVLEDGTLAGSILKMDEAARRMLQVLDIGLEHIIEMASINPAKQIGVFDQKGSIAVGKDADLLIVDNELHIKYTLCRGVIST